MMRTITEEVDAAGVDDVTRVILLRANGSDFCSGADLVQSNSPERSALPAGRYKPRSGHLQRDLQVGTHRMIEVIHNTQIPVVAAVRGWAAGVGNALALNAD